MDTKYLSKIVVNNTQYSIKDSEARQSISNILNSLTGAMHFIGYSTTPIVDGDGAASGPWTISGTQYVASGATSSQLNLRSGDVAIYFEKEYIWNDVSLKWQEYGSSGSLKALAFKDNATGSVSVSGTTTSTSASITGSSSSNLVTGSVGSASNWSAGTMFYVTVDENNEVATFVPGTTPSLTITQATVATGNISNEGSGSSVIVSSPSSVTIPSLTVSASGSVTVS